jgi:hypothetical protein
MWQVASLKNGRPNRTVTCTWKYIGPTPKSSGTFSMTPKVEPFDVFTDVGITTWLGTSYNNAKPV